MIGLPSDWQTCSLGEIGDWYGGGTPSKARADFWAQGTIPWLSPKDMGAEVVPATRDRITKQAVQSSAVRLVPAGSTAIVVRSGILEHTLPIAFVPFETTLNQDMKAVVPYSGVDQKWVAWALRAQGQELLRNCRKAGTTVASIDTRRLLSVRIPVPPLPEQQAAVEALEEQLARLDSVEEELQRIRARRAGLRRSLIQATVAGQMRPSMGRS